MILKQTYSNRFCFYLIFSITNVLDILYCNTDFKSSFYTTRPQRLVVFFFQKARLKFIKLRKKNAYTTHHRKISINFFKCSPNSLDEIMSVSLLSKHFQRNFIINPHVCLQWNYIAFVGKNSGFQDSNHYFTSLISSSEKISEFGTKNMRCFKQLNVTLQNSFESKADFPYQKQVFGKAKKQKK